MKAIGIILLVPLFTFARAGMRAAARARGRAGLAALVVALLLAGAGGLLATHQPLSRNVADYVLLARTRLKMKDFNFTGVGDVGVNEQGGVLVFGKSSNFPEGSEVVTDVETRIGDHSSLYLLFVNTYDAFNLTKSAIRHQPPTPWSPLPLIDPLPCDAACTPGTMGITVPKYGALDLAAESYGNVVVGNNATLTFTGNTYCLGSLKAGRGARLRFQSAGTRVRIAGNLKVNVGGTLGPDPTLPNLGAGDVRVDVGGKSAILSHKSRITALVYACDAVMRFGRTASLRGQFVANQVKSDFGSRLTLETCGDGKVDPGEQCDDGDHNGGPTSCCTVNCDYKAEGTLCPDADKCNGDEVCNAIGHCVAGPAPDCQITDACREGYCDAATGCQIRNRADQTPCPDTTVCNGEEVCVGGICQPGTPLVCADINPCTDDSCDQTNGCRHVTRPNCIFCPNGPSDCPGDACNPPTCIDQMCGTGSPPDCDDHNACTHDECDPQSGCVHPSLDGTPCNDNDACTSGDVCQNSACGGSTITCEDGDPCTSNDCNPASGCFFPPIPSCGQGGTFCTLTQGAYGATGGIANKNGTGWITQNPGVLPATVGGGGQSLTISDQTSLIGLLPCGTTANQLNPGNVTIVNGVPLPAQCDGGGVLTGQTVALSLSTALSNNNFNPAGLSSLTLPSSSFCTCAGAGPSAPYTISPCILANAATVNDLLILANQALGGINLGAIDICLSYSEINNALDTINNAFDECRTVCPCGP